MVSCINVSTCKSSQRVNFEDHCVPVMIDNNHMEVVCFDWEESGLLEERISNRGFVISLRIS